MPPGSHLYENQGPGAWRVRTEHCLPRWAGGRADAAIPKHSIIFFGGRPASSPWFFLTLTRPVWAPRRILESSVKFARRNRNPMLHLMAKHGASASGAQTTPRCVPRWTIVSFLTLLTALSPGESLPHSFFHPTGSPHRYLPTSQVPQPC